MVRQVRTQYEDSGFSNVTSLSELPGTTFFTVYVASAELLRCVRKGTIRALLATPTAHDSGKQEYIYNEILVELFWVTMDLLDFFWRLPN